ncbi:hypothetical protein [Parasphingorhabdus sp.]|uniref:hypothetical protein n=1 Tax=Parasphingorhabdus sp. TaxID=2709688 RepID=UPI0032631CA5
MIIPKRSVFVVLAVSLALASCQTVQVTETGAPAIGKILSANSDAKICRKGDCVAAKGKSINTDDVLKSGSLNMDFQLFGVNGVTTSHKLLGTAESWVREGKALKTQHVDGTLSGEVVDQPMHIQFGPSHNKPNRIAYCDFSTGQYEAINYIIFRFKIQHGTAVCTDTNGKKHKITDGVFEETP